MNRMQRAGLIIALGLCALPAAAQAAGFAIAEQGAVAGGTAGAGTARAGDPAAGWYNPAALADGDGTRVGVGAMAAVPTVSAHAPDGTWSAETASKVSTPPYLYWSLATGNHAFGLAAGVPFGSGVSWPAAWRGRHEIISSNLMIGRIAPFYAWRRGTWRVAGGAHLDLGRLQLDRALDFIDSDGKVAIDLSGLGFGIDAAVFWQASRELDLGLSFKSRSSLALSGTANFTAPVEFASKLPDQHAKTTLVVPDRLAAGAHWRRGRLGLLGDLELVTWSVHDTMTIDFANPSTPDVVETSSWQTTVAVRLGAEWQAAKTWQLRGGVYLDPSPAQDSTLAPSSPDSTRAGITLGAGHSFGKNLSLDLFYEYMSILQRSASNPEALAASYAGQAHFIGLGLRLGRD